MMISSKGRYALRVMTDLAEHAEDGYISLADISARQEISLKYLEAITSMLNKAGLVESLRGKSGGYKLHKKPEEYTPSTAPALQATRNVGVRPFALQCPSGKNSIS